MILFITFVQIWYNLLYINFNFYYQLYIKYLIMNYNYIQSKIIDKI